MGLHNSAYAKWFPLHSNHRSTNIIVPESPSGLMGFVAIMTVFACARVAVTPPDLMDPGATMWHPTLRKSSCSSCSQGSFSDGATPKGCNHERCETNTLQARFLHSHGLVQEFVTQRSASSFRTRAVIQNDQR